ncbi:MULTISPECIES: FAD-dependent oxidoreductase [unclassified Cupriavidus]|uniref:FAD-dependent oxidoreductase n=1 Tax=unclassified Cupriavidus TaxID=2640874 RepID=UPI003F93BA60
MLSNALALKKAPAALANFDAAAMARQLGATVRTHQVVGRIRAEAHAVESHGTALEYSRLVLAVGADPRRPPLRGTGAADVLCINDLRDYARFRLALANCRSVAILGAGLIGCEFANDLASAGFVVSLIDPAAAPLSRLLPQAAGHVYARGLHRHGVRMLLGRSVSTIEHEGWATA